MPLDDNDVLAVKGIIAEVVRLDVKPGLDRIFELIHGQEEKSNAAVAAAAMAVSTAANAAAQAVHVAAAAAAAAVIQHHKDCKALEEIAKLQKEYDTAKGIVTGVHLTMKQLYAAIILCSTVGGTIAFVVRHLFGF
jgi:metal-responsive CopG/Arc/MetJ family transcriptional regulator